MLHVQALPLKRDEAYPKKAQHIPMFVPLKPFAHLGGGGVRNRHRNTYTTVCQKVLPQNFV